jgi:hypothetical protein
MRLNKKPTTCATSSLQPKSLLTLHRKRHCSSATHYLRQVFRHHQHPEAHLEHQHPEEPVELHLEPVELHLGAPALLLVVLEAAEGATHSARCDTDTHTVLDLARPLMKF